MKGFHTISFLDVVRRCNKSDDTRYFVFEKVSKNHEKSNNILDRVSRIYLILDFLSIDRT